MRRQANSQPKGSHALILSEPRIKPIWDRFASKQTFGGKGGSLSNLPAYTNSTSDRLQQYICNGLHAGKVKSSSNFPATKSLIRYRFSGATLQGGLKGDSAKPSETLEPAFQGNAVTASCCAMTEMPELRLLPLCGEEPARETFNSCDPNSCLSL